MPLINNQLLKNLPFEFLISRKSRDKYQFEKILFSTKGGVLFQNIHEVRIFTKKMNDKLNLISFPELSVRVSEINGMGLEHEIFHHILSKYRDEIDPQLNESLLNYLLEQNDEEEIESIYKLFVDQFPNNKIYHNEMDLDEYLEGETDDTPNKHIIIEEILNLWLGNQNPAFQKYLELIDDQELERSGYLKVIDQVTSFLNKQPEFGPDSQKIIDLLQSPIEKAPHTISDQLEFIRENWSSIIDHDILIKILRALDLFKEEEKFRGLGPGEAQVLEYSDVGEENFSEDKDWMPRLVLIAKSSYVWLDQLSKKYNRDIRKLDQIPDEELDQLAQWGFTGLWLIGIWERSLASKRIKNYCGNPEAEASAYSIFDYSISNDLGGYEAYENLKNRASQRRIRLASDMVPNHMGIFSKWIIENPDRFLSLPYSPFPNYSFNGANLSSDDRVSIFLEDNYYNRTDAAVVFKHINNQSGETKFIYHGNDGTSMPWNDTAQLDYLNPETREAIIQTVIQVAKKFPIIRFDAAMTLTQKHFQRLWYPEPGSGGDIPTRSSLGLTKHAFLEKMPKEFWREVVERVQQEAPDTLLLAEAFWLLEGYFVRTLGMHRVYNSAFMNMLRDQKNQEYRLVLKNTLEFDPEILKRFVNFMNNPDEETAVKQFGSGDKYFGICLMMVTLPGLSMFGHGQIEGLSEKYGMEYRRAYWNEKPNEGLVEHHKQIIFPLLKKRYLFAEVRDFLLYDFFTPDGYVDENVFAYSNKFQNERVLIAYNNDINGSSGWIKSSVSYYDKKSSGLISKNLFEGLQLSRNNDLYCIFREKVSGLEFIRKNSEIRDNGLFLELSGYQYSILMDFREVQDNIYHHYQHLYDFLEGRGVPSIEDVLKDISFKPLHESFSSLISEEIIEKFYELLIINKKMKKEITDSLVDSLNNFIHEFSNYTQIPDKNKDEFTNSIILKVNSLTKLNELLVEFNISKKSISQYEFGILLYWIILHYIGFLKDEKDFELLSRSWIDEWRLSKFIDYELKSLRTKTDSPISSKLLVSILISHQHLMINKTFSYYNIITNLLNDPEVSTFLMINRYRDELYFNKEAFQILLKFLVYTNMLIRVSSGFEDKLHQLQEIKKLYSDIIKISEKCNYKVETLLSLLKI